MDTKQLATFISFAKERSLTKVSFKLNYAVSTLTDHINSLESELGVKLIERKGRQAVLTKNGENFLTYANKLMDTYKDACSVMAYFAGVKGLRIITTESVALYTMPSIYTKFSKLYPEVEISITIGNPNIFCDMLRNDKADIAFRFDWEPVVDEDLESIILYREPVVFIAHPNHHLTRKQNICAEDFNNETFIFPQKDSLYRNALNRVFQKKNITIQSKLYMDSGSMVKKCVQMGHGISLLPYSIVGEDLERGDLAQLSWKEEPFIATAYAIILKKDWIMPAIREIVDLSVKVLNHRKTSNNS